MYNKIIMVGNLTRDIELKYTPGGTAIGSTAIATTRKFKSPDGTQREEVCFVDITFFGRAAEIANQYLRKGSKVLIEGRLKFDQWTDQNGQKRSKHSVAVESMKMLDGKPQDGQQQQQGYTQPPQQQYSQPQQTYAQPPQQQPAQQPPVQSTLPGVSDDEIPF